jgi:serine O-acetyltransferase
VTIGENAKIGAGSVVVTNVPPNATVVGVPGHIVAYTNPENDTVLRLPDPEWDIIEELEGRVAELEARLAKVDGEKAGDPDPARPARRRSASAHRRSTKETK